jgi:hypothetical protein
MKKVRITPPHYYLVLFWVFNFTIAQNPSSMPLTPSGVLEKAFDRYGKDYQMSQLHIPSTNVINEEETVAFKLYFESGSGMEDLNNTLHVQRRNVLLTVLTDVENFLGIKSPDNKVNIWVRAINQASNSPCLRLGLGSSLYNILENSTGRIADGEVWKTLISDINAYTNVVNTPNDFYHGILAFNFSTCNGNTISWHTDLSTAPASRDYDLYSVMLKETMHLLGVTSLMNAQGSSVFGPNYKYYSRFDTKLKNHANTHHLITNTGNVSLYNWSFNTNLSLNVLRPGCTLPNHTNPNMADSSSCSNALKYVGSVTLPVYTPTCFEIGNSLSTFEDDLFPNCLLPHGNNAYFVMSNRNNAGTLKRYPKPEERLVLADLGYSLEAFYGLESTYLGYTEYDEALGNEEVVGVNDGVNSLNNTYSFFTHIGVPITIASAVILGNDYGNPTIITGLVNTTPNSGIVTMSGGQITFTPNSTFFGQVTLTYVPQSALGQVGGITEIYIYILRPNIINLPPFACEYVTNGNFENTSGFPTNYSQFNLVNFWSDYESTSPDFLHANAVNPNVGVPNNFYNPTPVPDNIPGNLAYGGFFIKNQTGLGFSGESLWTPLLQPLTSGQSYTLRFDVRKATYSNNVAFKMQALFTSALVPPTPFHQFPATFATASNNQLLTTPNLASTNNQWETITFNFTANGNHTYIYLGSLFQTGAPLGESFYYIDNVRLVSLDATNDSYTFSPSTNTQTSAISILANDNTQSLPPNYPGITITQVGGVVPVPAVGGISFNATGQVVVAPNTPVGAYTLQYFFSGLGPCSPSNIATVTVIISGTQAVFQVDDFYRGCDFFCQLLTPSILQIELYNGGMCWVNNNLPNGHGVLLNSVPATASTVTVELAPGATLPSGYILHPNATMTIPGFATTLELIFNVVFRSVAVPSATSDPVEVRVYINPYFLPNHDYISFFTTGNLQPGYSNNVAINDLRLSRCIRYDTTAMNLTNYAPINLPQHAVAVVVSNSSNNAVSLSPNGIISVSPGADVGSYLLIYKLCHPINTTFCSEEVTVYITVD